MQLPMAPVTLPTDLRGEPNGNLDVSLLTAVHSRGKLHHKAARAFNALVAECARNGLPLTFTYGGMYRTYAEQENLFRSRYTTSFLSGRPRKWWNGQWWYQRPGTAVAAVPGTSNHGLGLAVDTAFDTDPRDGLGPDDAAYIAGHPKFAWFVSTVGRYGFSFELQSEPWHIRYIAGDILPPAVKEYEATLKLGVLDPANNSWGRWPLIEKRAAKLDDVGTRIRYLEGVLKYKADQDVVMDNRFGGKTEDAVKNVQKFFGLPVDGWVGPTTWRVIDWLATT